MAKLQITSPVQLSDYIDSLTKRAFTDFLHQEATHAKALGIDTIDELQIELIVEEAKHKVRSHIENAVIAALDIPEKILYQYAEAQSKK